MHEKYFHAPVTMRVDEGQDASVATLSEMEGALNAWTGRRGKLYDLAVKACEAAQKGYITMDQTRRTLVALAEASGRLRADLESEYSPHTATRGYSSFA